MNKFFAKSKDKVAGKQPIIVVSGLPRSGTSMMMRMLAEGGLPGKIAWLANAGGKAVKVISALLEYLPPNYAYKVIFLEREIKEILISQRKMLANRNEASTANDAEIEAQIRTHLSVMKPWLVRQPNMEVLYVNYNMLMAKPGPLCEQITEFLELPLNQTRMLAVPDRHLYRNRIVAEE